MFTPAWTAMARETYGEPGGSRFWTISCRRSLTFVLRMDWDGS